MGEAKRRSEISPDRLRELFAYDSETGSLTCRIRRGRALAGAPAGTRHPSGYIRVTVDGMHTCAHHVIWCMVKGYWPNELDHRNLIESDNRWSNLREATRSQNGMNKGVSRSNRLGIKGVSKEGNRFRARFRLGTRVRSLGTFCTPDEAAAAYREMAMHYHGEFYRGHGQ